MVTPLDGGATLHATLTNERATWEMCADLLVDMRDCNLQGLRRARLFAKPPVL